MLSLDNSRLRMLEEKDLSFVKDLRLDYSTAINLGTFLFTNDFCQQKWFEYISASPKEMFLIYEEMDEDFSWHKVGYVRLSDIDRINSSVCIGADINSRERGKGFGVKIYNIALKLCFDYWNINRVWLLVIEYNKPAIKLYQKMGFVEEGVQRNAIFRDGSYHNYIMMSLLKEEYNEKSNTIV